MDVHGCKTTADGAILHIFAYGVGSPIVGVIPDPWLGGNWQDCPPLDSEMSVLVGLRLCARCLQNIVGPRLSMNTGRGVCVCICG